MPYGEFFSIFQTSIMLNFLVVVSSIFGVDPPHDAVRDPVNVQHRDRGIMRKNFANYAQRF